MGRVHLIGVDHIIQHDGAIEIPTVADTIHRFQAYLRQQVENTGATVLAEEFSIEANKGDKATTVGQVARNLEIEHLLCDPTEAERVQQCICNVDQRETYWATQLAPWAAEEIIFVCGDTHIATFPTVLERQGFKSRVLSEGQWPNPVPVLKLSDL
jgi:hypothetical protein